MSVFWSWLGVGANLVIGLLLAPYVVRKLGGSVTARNLAERGAAVSLSLPLQALTVGTLRHAG